LTMTIATLAWPLTISIFAIVMLGSELAAIFVMIGLAMFAATYWLPLRLKLIAALLAGLAFGFLRAEHLQTSPPTMHVTMRQPDGALATVPANVIMSADRGLLLVTTSNQAVRYVPWELISAVDKRDRMPALRIMLADVRRMAREWMAAW
jgi:hypothetical protein